MAANSTSPQFPALLRVNPGSAHASACVGARVAGVGRAIKKCDVYEHAARLEILRRTGFNTWAEYKASKHQEADHWLKSL